MFRENWPDIISFILVDIYNRLSFSLVDIVVEIGGFGVRMRWNAFILLFMGGKRLRVILSIISWSHSLRFEVAWVTDVLNGNFNYWANVIKEFEYYYVYRWLRVELLRGHSYCIKCFVAYTQGVDSPWGYNPLYLYAYGIKNLNLNVWVYPHAWVCMSLPDGNICIWI